MKKQNGITLIALIITIVVLLILAVVAIGSVKNGGVVTKAEQAADKYTQAQNNELAMLDSYVGEIEKSQQKIGKVGDLKTGDFITYDDGTENKLYEVLHNSDTEGLQIVSTEIKGKLKLTGLSDFANRFEKFKSACAPYVKKELGAIDGRVLGYSFNDLKNLTEKQYTFELNDGSTRVEKVYLRNNSSEDIIDYSVTVAVLTAYSQATGEIIAEDFWLSSHDIGTNTLGNQEFKVAHYSPTAAATKFLTTSTLAEYRSSTQTIHDNPLEKGIIPVILLDQRINVISGDGSFDTPYVYEFNK